MRLSVGSNAPARIMESVAIHSAYFEILSLIPIYNRERINQEAKKTFLRRDHLCQTSVWPESCSWDKNRPMKVAGEQSCQNRKIVGENRRNSRKGKVGTGILAKRKNSSRSASNISAWKIESIMDAFRPTAASKGNSVMTSNNRKKSNMILPPSKISLHGTSFTLHNWVSVDRRVIFYANPSLGSHDRKTVNLNFYRA